MAGIQPSHWCVQHTVEGVQSSSQQFRSQIEGSREAEVGTHLEYCRATRIKNLNEAYGFSPSSVTGSNFFFLRKYVFKGIYVTEIALYIRVLLLYTRAPLTVVNR